MGLLSVPDQADKNSGCESALFASDGSVNQKIPCQKYRHTFIFGLTGWRVNDC